jgi:hypothetical protein
MRFFVPRGKPETSARSIFADSSTVRANVTCRHGDESHQPRQGERRRPAHLKNEKYAEAAKGAKADGAKENLFPQQEWFGVTERVGRTPPKSDRTSYE